MIGHLLYRHVGKIITEDNMMDMNTQENWYVDEGHDGLRVLNEQKTIICQQIGPVSNLEARADAELIAKAPAMRDLLKVCRSKMEPSSELGKAIETLLNSP